MTASQAIVRMLPINSIAAISNIRISNGHDKESLAQLADSIKAHGLIQPVVVRPMNEDEQAGSDSPPSSFVIVAGRRRLAACKLAGMNDIPALVSATDEAKAYELEIAENIQREQMTLADTARAVRTLMMIHDSAKKVAAIVNKSPAWVSKHLTITASAMPDTIAELLDRGIVEDLETLLLLRQLAIQPASNEKAHTELVRMLRIAHAGNMSRSLARDALAKVKAPAVAAPSPGAIRTTKQTELLSGVSHENSDPAETFTVRLPIKLMAAFEAKGGEDWLRELLGAE